MDWIKITKEPIAYPEVVTLLRRFIQACSEVSVGSNETVGSVNALLKEYSGRLQSLSGEAMRYGVPLFRVLADLIKIGWGVEVRQKDLYILRPGEETAVEIRARISSLRHGQLEVPSVQSFIRGMESWKSYRGHQVSILSLIADGRELEQRLSAFSQGNAPAPVQPYVEAVTSEGRCKHTGLRLQDIWRYFRHTWSNPYESIPGRSMQFLVRDGAHPMGAVMGIFSLSSAAVRLTGRDQFIGWDTDTLVREISENPVPKYGRWIRNTIEAALSDVYQEDLIEEGLIRPMDWGDQRSQVAVLENEAKHQKEVHHRLQKEKRSEHTDTTDWQAAALTPLFKSKRCAELALLLRLREEVNEWLGTNPNRKRISQMMASGPGRTVVERVARVARSKTVGTHIADLTVCGAIAPYNHIAAGKLVAMLAVSPETIKLYNNRYSDSVSIIASSMAGREIIRRSDLVYVGTTSLYGKRPNQYDRIKIPGDLIGGKSNTSIRYQFIRERTRQGHTRSSTKGIGSFHFSPDTVKSLEDYCSSTKGGWKVNRVFGEGTSPKLRGIREGLGALGLAEEALLTHGITRCVYGVRLVSNLNEYLLGMAKNPKYTFSLRGVTKSTERIGQWWLTRWAAPRFIREEIQDRILRETLVYPITHSGRVELPVEDIQEDLFE